MFAIKLVGVRKLARKAAKVVFLYPRGLSSCVGLECRFCPSSGGINLHPGREKVRHPKTVGIERDDANGDDTLAGAIQNRSQLLHSHFSCAGLVVHLHFRRVDFDNIAEGFWPEKDLSCIGRVSAEIVGRS